MNTYPLLESNQPPVQPPSEEDDFVLRDILNLIIDQIWWVVGIAGAILLMAVIYARVATPIYSADAMIQVEQPNPNTNTPGAAAGVQSQPSGPLPTDAEIEIIKSRAVLQPVITQYRLDISAAPRVFPFLGGLAWRFATPGKPSRPWLWLKSYAWGGEIINLDALTVPADLEGQQLRLRALGAGRYALSRPNGQPLLEGKVGEMASGNGVTILVKQLVARPDTEFTVTRANELSALQGLASALQIAEQGKDTGIVKISLAGSDPVIDTNIANAVALSYLKQHIERSQAEANKMLKFLNGELPGLRAELQKAELALSRYQASSKSFQPTLEAQSYLAGGLDYERQIASLKMQRLQLLQRYTPENPAVKTVDSQLAQLNQEKSSFERRFQSLPSSERTSVGLTRDAKVAEDIYVTLLNKTQELSITRAGTIGNVRILDYALRPSTPIKPKRALIISAGAVLGLTAGVLFAFVRRKLFTGVEDPAFIERTFHLPIFGSIPFSEEQGKLDNHMEPAQILWNRLRAASSQALPASLRPALPAAAETAVVPAPRRRRKNIKQSLLAKRSPYDLSIEGLRGFRTSLQFALVDAPNKIIAITSPAPRAGKSFLSANLAVLLAETGKRVLLIDADLRRGRLADYFGRGRRGGLTQLLSGQIDLRSAIADTQVPHLSFMAAGARAPNPSEILMSPRFAQLLEQLDQQYDMVIVDTPPVLAVTDASIVAHLAGVTILVLRSGAHTEREIGESLKKLARAQARVTAGVVNAVANRRSNAYGMYRYTYEYQTEEL